MSAAQPSPSEQDIQLLRDTEAAAQAGDLPRAIAVAERALAGGLQHPLFYRLRGLKHEQAGRLEAAVADFRAALADAPQDAPVLSLCGLCLARLGRMEEGMRLVDAALRLQPDYASAHVNRGWILESLGDLPGARAAYRRALELDPRLPRAGSGLALLAARAGDWEEARRAAALALQADPNAVSARLAQAMAALGQGDAEFAEREALALSNRPQLTGHDRGVVFTLLGDALDRQDRTEEAFKAYDTANAALRDVHARQFGPGGLEPGLAIAERLTKAFARTKPEDWRAAPEASESPAEGHVFVLGFPRSGTTLLGQVLGAHPLVTTLDEAETLAGPARAYLSDEKGLARLAAAGSAELASFREAYWQGIRARGAELDGRVLIDKLPTNTLGLPLIARLFPAAKVIFARRDPRDVALSCFRRQFVVNSATWEFLSLERTARFYAATMRLAGDYMAALPLDLKVLRYEAFVEDFRRQAADLCAFIGVPEDPATIDFKGAAKAADVATPSAAQVAGGVSGEGAGQWRRYASELTPVLPILQPWVETFGYDPL